MSKVSAALVFNTMQVLAVRADEAGMRELGAVYQKSADRLYDEAMNSFFKLNGKSKR